MDAKNNGAESANKKTSAEGATRDTSAEGATRNKPNELYLTRLYDAPVSLVWDAWTDPDQVAKWWGPRGFTITTHGKDLRPGGHWTYTMHGPDGTDYPNKTIYHEVDAGKRLVYDHGGHDDRPPLFRVTVTFEEIARDKTRMELTMALATPEAAAEAKKFIKKAGGDSTWDRLAEYLAEEGGHGDRFVINRSFEAPIETVFRMWSDPEQLSRWLPPTGFTMKVLRGDIRKGGSTFWSMSNGTVTMYGRAEYLKVWAPRRLVYTQRFCDSQEKPARHYAAPTWPDVMLTSVELAPEGEARTRVTVTWEPYGNVTAEERATFRDGRAGMTMGWTGSFDKLEAVL